MWLVMKRYDSIILLGTQPDLETWEFPQQIHECIKTISRLYKSGVAEKVIASGRWSRRVENQSLSQPFHECDKLAELLSAAGVPDEATLRERLSTDTVSNLYYVKTEFLLPKQWQNLLFVVASFRIPRLKLLADKVFGPEYNVDYEPIETAEGPSYNEAKTIQRSEEFLAPMKDGDHAWLQDKFYGDPFYARVTRKNQASST